MESHRQELGGGGGAQRQGAGEGRGGRSEAEGGSRSACGARRGSVLSRNGVMRGCFSICGQDQVVAAPQALLGKAVCGWA